MQIGVNWLSPRTLPIVRQLLAEGHADFCEIMVDNVIQFSPDKILAALPHMPIALHIVSSRFLEKSTADLQAMAQYLRPWIAALQPIYVSDHIGRFTDENGVRLPRIAEYDYEKNYPHIKNRVSEWQALLNTKLLIENCASVNMNGKQQAMFYEQLIADTGADLLFDFSNAYIAEHNRVAPVTSWDALVQNTTHFHVAGYRIDKTTQLAIDTHDMPISEEVLNVMHMQKNNLHGKTLVIEFDESVDIERWQHEIHKIKNVVQDVNRN